MKKHLEPLTVHQLATIEYLKTVEGASRKKILDNVKIHKSFQMSFENLMGELVELDYVKSDFISNRKIYSLNGDIF